MKKCTHFWEDVDDNRDFVTQECSKCGKVRTVPWNEIGWEESEK